MNMFVFNRPGDLVRYVKERETIGIVIGTGLAYDPTGDKTVNVLIFISDLGLHWTRQGSIETCP